MPVMIMMKLSWFVLLSSSLVVFAILDFAAAKGSVFTSQSLSRGDFPSPPHMVFGAATSAFQYEGAAFEDGKTSCIWDTFSHSAESGRTTRAHSACDGYHKYKEDVQLMVDTGLEAYRFSISWLRLLPSRRGNANPKALEYYNNLINELIRSGIEPHVTLVHYDPPQVLEDEYGGWISQNMVEDFTAYADVCFREFGDRISHWITVNEANMFALGAYDNGSIPPQRCSFPYGNCSAGNSSIEPYIVAHHFLLAHASAARLYKTKYQASQHRFIGINLLAYGTIPYTNTTEDVIAIKRYNDFFVGWFLDPLMFGDYPVIMKQNAATRIPALNKKESELIKGSADFIGVNFYYTAYVMDKSSSLENDNRDYLGDMAAEYVYQNRNVDYLCETEGVIKTALLVAVVHPKDTLPDPTLLSELPVMLSPLVWYNFLSISSSFMATARNGSNVKCYFYWSFMDLVELIYEETSFGLYYVDLDSKDLTRYPKLSTLVLGFLERKQQHQS